uniref:Copia protein n=1 Tax=Tanacetum cinerariifolium TaxID=118510 RepID=A0A6L2LRX5_TANCI|nr:copia protein [Tanacetum cinerariifolium]
MHKTFPLPVMSSYCQKKFPQPVKKVPTEVIEFGDSYENPNDNTATGSASDETSKKKGMSVTLTTDDMQKRKNDVKARTTLLLALPDEHQLRFSKHKTAQELWAAILKTFGGNEATKKTKKNLLKQQYGNFKAEGSETLERIFNRLQVIRNRSDLNTMSLDDLYNHLKVYESEVQKKSESNSQNIAFISSAKHSSGNEEVNIASVSTASTNVSTASGSVRLPEAKTEERETTKDKVNHALIADEEAPTEFALMAKTSAKSEIFDNSLCFKAFEARLAEHRNQELKYCEKIRILEFKTKSRANCIESLTKELELIKKEKEGLDSKLAGFLTASKDLDSLLMSQRLDKNKEGLGYSTVPPLPAQVYSPPKKDLSWIGLPEFADDTVTDYSRPAPTVESSPDDAQNRNPSVTATEASPKCIVLGRNFKLSDDANVFLRTPRQHNMYSIDLNIIVPHKDLTCLVAKASADECMLWHRRLGRLNFKTMNKFVRHNLVRGLPTKCFENDHTCTAFLKGMQHKASCTNSTNFSGTKDAASQEVKKDVSSLRYIALPNWVHDALLESSSSKPQDDCSTNAPESSGNSNPIATSTYPPADQLETLTVETPIPNVSSLVPTACLNDSPDLKTFLELQQIRLIQMEADVSNMETTIIASPTLTLRIHKDHPKSQIIGPVDTPIQTRHKSKEVLKNKKDERGIVIRNKARLVAQGHTQEEGIDYEEVFASVARIEAIRLFLAYASYMGFTVYQMAVKSAFLYGTINEEVYVMQPFGFQDPEFPAKVYKVEKAMYGLHQAPRAWYESPFDLVAYSDSDYGGATQDRKSTTGGCQFLGRRLISWQCKKQIIMATSITKVEYVAAASCCGQVLWIQNQLLDYRHHFITDCFEKKLISVDHIHTDENVADLLTKPFDEERFQYLVVEHAMRGSV